MNVAAAIDEDVRSGYSDDAIGSGVEVEPVHVLDAPGDAVDAQPAWVLDIDEINSTLLMRRVIVGDLDAAFVRPGAAHRRHHRPRRRPPRHLHCSAIADPGQARRRSGPADCRAGTGPVARARGGEGQSLAYPAQLPLPHAASFAGVALADHTVACGPGECPLLVKVFGCRPAAIARRGEGRRSKAAKHGPAGFARWAMGI